MKRIEQIDILRGFALFGIILTHMMEGYIAAIVPDKYVNFNIFYPVDSLLKETIKYFFVSKFYTIFSLLFGFSFYLILERKSDNKTGLFIWRLIILLFIGLLHQIHYRGDILIVYVFFGFLLLFLKNFSNKTILLLGLILSLNTPMVLIRLTPLVSSTSTKQVNITNDLKSLFLHKNTNLTTSNIKNSDDNINNDKYFTYVLQGKYLNLIKSNITSGIINKIYFFINTGKGFVTLGLLLIGLWIGRKKWHERINEIPLVSILVIALFIGISTTFTNIYLNNGTTLREQYLNSLSNDLSNFFMTLFYISFVLLILKSKTGCLILSKLAPVGKMSLTNYLLQSVFGILIFYGYGLGLLLKIPASIALVIAIIFFIIQIIFSQWWLLRFKYGPIEWLWRSATFRKWQNLKI